MSRFSPTRPTHRFTPRFDLLEDRTVPTVMASQAGNVITLTGNQANDTINITDNGLNSAGAIIITGNLSTGTFTSLEVSPGLPIFIVIDTKGGRDTVSYRLTGSFNRSQPNSESTTPISATGGRGISALLGADDDSFSFDVNNTANNQALDAGVDVINALLSIQVNGQAGDDKIGIGYFGDIRNGRVNLEALGSSGDDRVFVAESIFGSEGALNNALVDGGSGEDDLGLILYRNRSFFPINSGSSTPTATPFTGSTARLVGTGLDTAVVTSGNVINSVPARRTVFV